MSEEQKKFKLIRKLDRVFLRYDGSDEEQPVRLVWPRPISARGKEVSIIGEGKKEILMLDSLDRLDSESRAVAKEELERRYLVARITRVIGTQVDFGNRYWHVDTDRGERKFLIKEPSKNMIWFNDDRIILRDTLGNHHEIESYSSLDARSRAEAERAM